MKFIKDRLEIVLEQLKEQTIVQSFPITGWKVKEKCFVDVKEADADPSEFGDFDSKTMRWYGKDKHYWFRREVVVPKAFEGKNLWLHIRTQIDESDNCRNPQFLIFVNGVPIQGMDINHSEVRLTDSAHAGDFFQVDLQAYTGTNHDEFKLLADLEERDELIKDLYYDIQVPWWGLARMEENDRTALRILDVLNETVNLIDFRKIYSEEYYASLKAARDYIRKNLYENSELAGFDDVLATCIGHTHIDVAWLWTVAQTRQKACRSFATVIKLMEEFPKYKFMSSQPQLYEFVKERHPELYAKIKERVKEGRWEPEGGMWVEADCNLTSGESLVRQFLFGKRFFKEEFDKDNVILWLPDVFGYSAALPQIMKKCGIKYFMTTKIAWNEYNKLPMDSFWWEGIDGSRIFTHFITTSDLNQDPDDFYCTYNGVLHPDSIMGGWRRYQQKDINNDILVSFGWGDGGGGPTRSMLETAERMDKGIKNIPKVRQEFARTYFDRLLDRVNGNKRLPSWVGELYFEFHRGTYTSMARNKRSNRKAEYRMMELELLSVLAENKVAYPTKDLNDMWKLILRNQFHDILPGSSIHEVYEVTKEEYAKIDKKSGALLDERIKAITPEGKGVTVFNTLGFERNDVVNLGNIEAKALSDGKETYPVQKTEDGAVAFVKNIPSKGYKCFDIVTGEAGSNAFSVTDCGIETPFYRVKFDHVGQIVSLYDKEAEREVIVSGRVGNELRVYEDKPRVFDNWNIDVYYSEKSWPVAEDAHCEWEEKGPVRATLKVTKKMLDNEFVQRIRFYKDDRRIDFETEIDWKLSQHLVKVHFPMDIHTDEATFDIQFGNAKRKIHQNTSWDEARFESCAHKFADMSEGGYGVALMNDCKYGYSFLDGAMSITLLKAGIDPNKTADLEKHYFTYSLLPHMGSWQEAGVYKESFNLNVPLKTVQGGASGKDYSFMSVDADNVILETIKQAEDGNGIIVRLYETENKRSKVMLKTAFEIRAAEETDLLEKPVERLALPADRNEITFEIRPYEIKTFKIISK